MPFEARPDDFLVLEQVTTLAQAARDCGCARKTIEYAIDAGNIAALKCGGVWLISVSSLGSWNRKRLSKRR